MKKAIQDKLAMGMVGVICFDFVILIMLTTGLNFFEDEYLPFVLILIIIISWITAGKLSKDYDKDDNFDGYAYLISFFSFCLAVGGLLLHSKLAGH